jgi:hypothetical protein
MGYTCRDNLRETQISVSFGSVFDFWNSIQGRSRSYRDVLGSPEFIADQETVGRKLHEMPRHCRTTKPPTPTPSVHQQQHRTYPSWPRAYGLFDRTNDPVRRHNPSPAFRSLFALARISDISIGPSPNSPALARRVRSRRYPPAELICPALSKIAAMATAAFSGPITSQASW